MEPWRLCGAAKNITLGSKSLSVSESVSESKADFDTDPDIDPASIVMFKSKPTSNLKQPLNLMQPPATLNIEHF